MNRQKLILISFAISSAVAVLHLLAIELHFYWTINYFDSMLHFLAGISVGFAGVWWALRDKMTMTSQEVYKASIVSILVIGILWEIFETSAGITSFVSGINYVTDTTSDLVMDLLGGLMAGVYIHQFILKKNE